MSERIFTLFGEEIIPEQPKPVSKSRAKKTAEEKQTEEKTPEEKVAEEKAPEITNEETGEAPEAGIIQDEQEIDNTQEVNEAAQKKAPAKKSDKVNLPEDWEGEKKYYTIGEVATLFNVKTSHIRFWTNEFKLKVRTTRKGDRLFNPEQIKELRAIHHLVKERGFTLSGAKAKLKTENKRDVETIDLKQSLKQLRNKLVIIRNQLT